MSFVLGSDVFVVINIARLSLNVCVRIHFLIRPDNITQQVAFQQYKSGYGYTKQARFSRGANDSKYSARSARNTTRPSRSGSGFARLGCYLYRIQAKSGY